MSTLRLNDVEIHYERTGDGPTALCLIHGSGGSSAAWRPQLARIADTARVIALDLPGHGKSSGDGCVRIEEYAAVVREFVRRLQLEHFVIGGHSMGGAVAQAFALAHPTLLTGLVLVGTGARLRVLPRIFELLEKDYSEGVRFVVQKALAISAPREIRESLVHQMLQTPQRVTVGDLRSCDAFDVMEQISKLKVPTLIICGTEDELTPPKYAQFLATKISTAKLILIPGAGHYVQLERPEETTAGIRNFLATLNP